LPLKVREIKKALTSKGFKEGEKRDHLYYFLYYEGKKTAVFTKISHGEQEINDNLCAQMAKQTKLTNVQFRKLVDCGLTGEGYITILIHANVLEAKKQP
jgi:predicted RNA binding protein YcfA (HicA-like mRNA interferase family)